jgi:hypothetical protein
MCDKAPDSQSLNKNRSISGNRCEALGTINFMIAKENLGVGPDLTQQSSVSQ